MYINHQGENEILRNITEHINFMENLSEISNIYLDNCNDDYYVYSNDSDSQILFLYLQYLNVKNFDLNLIKNKILLDNDIIYKNINSLKSPYEDLERELKIVVKEKIEMFDEKEKIENEISKFKVK